MGVSVEKNLAFLSKDRLRRVVDNQKKLLAERIIFDTNQFVPFDTGELKASATIENGYIVYKAPYAKKMYYAKAVSTRQSPLATPEWFRVAKLIYLPQWLAIAQKNFIEELRG